MDLIRVTETVQRMVKEVRRKIRSSDVKRSDLRVCIYNVEVTMKSLRRVVRRCETSAEIKGILADLDRHLVELQRVADL
jgi:hypothetical protein